MIIVRFKTKSGSTYEINEATQSFRQADGIGPERRKQWRRYATKLGPEVGARCVLVLHEDQQTVITTHVTQVEDVS